MLENRSRLHNWQFQDGKTSHFPIAAAFMPNEKKTAEMLRKRGFRRESGPSNNRAEQDWDAAH
jgi:hypothetical protein